MKKLSSREKINLHIDLFKEILDKSTGDSVIFPEEGLNLNGSRYNLKIFELDKPENYYISLEDREKDLDIISSLATPQDPWIALDNDSTAVELISEYMNTDYLLKVGVKGYDFIFFGYPADTGFIVNRHFDAMGYFPTVSLNCCLSFVEDDNNLLLHKLYYPGDTALCRFDDVDYISKASSKETWLYNEIQRKKERGN